jgi:hypothetical protein
MLKNLLQKGFVVYTNLKMTIVSCILTEVTMAAPLARLILVLSTSAFALRVGPAGSAGPQGPHKLFTATKLFDLRGERVLVEAGGGLQTVHIPTGLRKTHRHHQGFLQGAVFDPTTPGRTVQHIVDDSYNTIYCGDDVISASTRAVTSFGVSEPGGTVIVIFDTGMVDWVNTKTGEARSVDVVRHFNDLPTCAKAFGEGYTAIGTVSGRLKILDESGKRCLGQVEHPQCAAVTALCVAPIRNRLHRVHVAYIDGTERRCVFDTLKKQLRSEPSFGAGGGGDESIVVSIDCNDRFTVKTLLTGESIYVSHDLKKKTCLPVGSSLEPVLVSDKYVALKPNKASVLVYPL